MKGLPCFHYYIQYRTDEILTTENLRQYRIDEMVHSIVILCQIKEIKNLLFNARQNFGMMQTAQRRIERRQSYAGMPMKQGG